MILSRYLKLGVLVALALGVWFPLAAQEEPTEAEDQPAWKGSLGFSFLSSGGNTETESLGLDLAAERTPDPWGLTVGALFHRAAEDGNTTADRYFAQIRGRRVLSERWETFVGLSAEQDKFADIDLRAILEAGGTYKALLGPKHSLAFDLGLNWTDEDRVEPEPDQSYLGALAGLLYGWKISETADFSQRMVYFANFDESGDWRLESLTALTAAVSERLAVRLSYELRYRNQPIDANDDTDTVLKASVVMNL